MTFKSITTEPERTTTGNNSNNNRVPNRDKMGVAADMLRVMMKLEEYGGAAKTKILYGASLSYTQIEHYLPRLITAGLVAKSQDGQYFPTVKGREFVASYDQTRGYLRTVEL